jgi:hypothetical protein
MPSLAKHQKWLAFCPGSCIEAYIGSIVGERGCMKLRQIARKLQAVAALFALLVTGVAGLAESLPVSDLPFCCNAVYCPVHPRQAHEFQKDKSKCDAQGHLAGNDCSMRACDTTPSPVVGTAPFVLVAPIALRSPASAEPARIQAPHFFSFIASIPLTPPPRTLPS